MSSVYRAFDKAASESPVAIKILNTAQPDEIKRKVFKRETDALKRLNHPNIVSPNPPMRRGIAGQVRDVRPGEWFARPWFRSE